MDLMVISLYRQVKVPEFERSMSRGGLTMLKLKPLGDKIIVKPAAAEEKTAGGIYVPDTAKKKSTEGEVMAVGRGKFADGKFVEPEVKVGDTVIYSKYGGTEVTIKDVDYVILDEDSILAIKG
jgi:chaperonin GroES